jgi:folylpolyglutamate synthase/dihydropteroate synthase
LIDIKERFETEKGLITEEEFVEILNKILNLKIELSYFEKCVLIALEFFKMKKCEYVVLEV